jgi:hypothetical protein
VGANAIVGFQAPDHLEAGDHVSAARHASRVDDAGPRAQPRERLNNQREAMGQAGFGASPACLLASDHPEAVVLDLVQPVLAGGRLRG